MSTKKRVTVLEPISSQIIYDNTTEAPKLRVAAYARVSTEQDEQQSSYEAQVNYYDHYIRNNPAWAFVGIYADDYIMIYKTGIIRDFFVFCRRQICSMQESFVMLQTDRSLIWMWTIRADVVNFSKFAGKYICLCFEKSPYFR